LGLEAGFGRLLWPALFFPLLAFALVELFAAARAAPLPAGRAIRHGLALLVIGVGLELAWAPFEIAGGTVASPPDVIEVAIEEGLELGGWIILAAGLAACVYRAIERLP
jgi:hypothetical protein